MAKLKLVANPTFKAMVSIPVAGDEPAMVEMTFNHRTKTQLDEFIKASAEKKDADVFMEMVSGWELEDAFTRESIETLLENYIGTALAVFQKYIDELYKAKVKN
jgi:hypothetical protein